MNDYQRIEEIKKIYNFRSDRSLAADLGINVQIFYDVKAGKCKISHETADRIQDKFKNINRVWLLTGEGEMLRTEKKTENISENISDDVVMSREIFYQMVKFTEAISNQQQAINNQQQTINCQQQTIAALTAQQSEIIRLAEAKKITALEGKDVECADAKSSSSVAI